MKLLLAIAMLCVLSAGVAHAANLNVYCSPAVHTDGTHHYVCVDGPNNCPVTADANGFALLTGLMLGYHDLYVCGQLVLHHVLAPGTCYPTGCP